MPAFQINDEEWSALVEEPGDIFLVYCSIRRFMDYRTGVAGKTRRISEQMISEVLYVAPTRGRHESGSPTRQRVRSVIDRLVKLKVIVPVGPMVYELPLATSDLSSKTSATDEQPDQQPYQQPNENQAKPSNSGALGDSGNESTTGSASPETLNSNLPPVSGNTYTQHNAHVREIGSRPRFQMTDSWEPSPQTFAAVLHRNGLQNATLDPDLLLEFRSYWIGHPDKHYTQAQWEHRLAQQLKRNQQLSEGATHETHRRNAPRRTRNAIDVYNDNNW